jgi:hypothetical protein
MKSHNAHQRKPPARDAHGRIATRSTGPTSPRPTIDTQASARALQQQIDASNRMLPDMHQDPAVPGDRGPLAPRETDSQVFDENDQ